MKQMSRRRTTRGRGTRIGGVTTVRKATVRTDLTVPEGTPNSRVCHCGANVPVLFNGRLKAHAAGGTRPNVARGEYKCEGSGSI